MANLWTPVQARATLNSADNWFTRSLIGAPNASGQTVTPRSALGLSAYYACIRNISEDLAKTPIRMVEVQSNGSFSAVNSHPALTLMSDQPNPMMDPMDFWTTIIAHMLGWQGGFAEIVRNGFDDPIEMWPLDPSTVRIMWDGVKKTLAYEVSTGGRTVLLRPEDVFHIKGLGFDGFTSFLIADIAKLSIGRALATQEFSAAFFGNGAQLKGVLEAPATLTEPGMKLLRDTFTLRHSGAGQSWKTPILPEGVVYKEISTDPEKSQLIMAMHSGIEDMARIFRMPPQKIQHDVRSTFNNVAEQNKFYQHDTLSGHAKRICEQGRSKLLSGLADKNKRFKHDFSDLLEADPVSQADVETKQFMTGQWTTNELMAKRGRKGIGKIGDRRFVPANLIALDKLDEEPKPIPVPVAPPEPEPPEPKTVLLMDSPQIKAIIRLFRQDFRRFATTEEKQAMGKIANGKLEEWADKYYPKQERYLAGHLAVPFEVLRTALGVDCDVRDLGKRMAGEYMRESRDRIMAGSRNEDTETLDRFAGMMAVRAVNMVIKEAA